MARRKKSETDEVPGSDEESGGGGMDFNLTKEHRQAIMAIVYNNEKVKLDKEAIKEDVAAVAAKIGCKPAEVNSMVSVIIQEREKGGVIESRERSLELAKQILDDEDVTAPRPEGDVE